MELLSDDSATDMSAKEIMRRWEQRGKDPNAPAVATSPKNQGGIAKRKDERNAPQITDADNNPTAMAGVSSERHTANAGGNKNNSPSRNDMGTPYQPYGQNPQVSAESHRTASPQRHSYRSSQYQKQTQISTTGAG
jgi:hypothetical protein